MQLTRDLRELIDTYNEYYDELIVTHNAIGAGITTKRRRECWAFSFGEILELNDRFEIAVAALVDEGIKKGLIK